MRKEQNRSIFSICEARRAGGLSHYWKYSNWTIFLPPFLCHAAQVGKKRAFLSRQRADYFFLPASSSVKFFLMKKLLSWNTRNFNVSCFFFICAFHTKSRTKHSKLQSFVSLEFKRSFSFYGACQGSFHLQLSSNCAANEKILASFRKRLSLKLVFWVEEEINWQRQKFPSAPFLRINNFLAASAHRCLYLFKPCNFLFKLVWRNIRKHTPNI